MYCRAHITTTLTPIQLTVLGGQIIIALQIFRYSYGPTGLEPHDRVMESKKTWLKLDLGA